MITNPRPLTTGDVFLLCAGALVLVVLYLVFIRKDRSLPAAIALALFATVAATAPFTAWAVGRDAVHARDYSSFAADRVGPEDNGVDTTVIDRAATFIPRDVRYRIFTARSVGADRSSIFRFWALTSLLPRIAVGSTAKAQWFLTVGAPPSGFFLDATDVHMIPSARGRSLSVWVGRKR